MVLSAISVWLKKTEKLGCFYPVCLQVSNYSLCVGECVCMCVLAKEREEESERNAMRKDFTHWWKASIIMLCWYGVFLCLCVCGCVCVYTSTQEISIMWYRPYLKTHSYLLLKFSDSDTEAMQFVIQPLIVTNVIYSGFHFLYYYRNFPFLFLFTFLLTLL